MRQETTSPIVLAHARTTEGVAFQLRRDAKGVLEVPGLANVLISIHVGAPATLACRRDGKRHTGPAVHGDTERCTVRSRVGGVVGPNTSGFALCATAGRSESVFSGRDAGSDRRRGRDALESSALGKHCDHLARILSGGKVCEARTGPVHPVIFVPHVLWPISGFLGYDSPPCEL
jgi:hypothetical protein